MVESTWESSGLAKDAKNLGGIKGNGPAGQYNAKTKEFFNGKEEEIKDGFKAYNSNTEFYADYAKLISSRYKKALNKTGTDYYQALKDGNYATHPDYAKGIEPLYNQLGKIR